MKKALFLFVIILTPILGFSQLEKKIQFLSLDSIMMTADLYLANKENAPFILLCHQAKSSRGEYTAIAPFLLEEGYNCMAIDQRSGLDMAGKDNETYEAAAWGKRNLDYLSAEQDILAAIKYIKTNYPKSKKLILWGSSYSASLSLKIGAENDDVDVVVAFSPGEYFGQLKKPDDWIQQSVANLKKPVFITSGKFEIDQWGKIYKAIPSKKKANYIPKGEGIHGSRNLWDVYPDHQEYKDAVLEFLKKNTRCMG